MSGNAEGLVQVLVRGDCVKGRGEAQQRDGTQLFTDFGHLGGGVIVEAAVKFGKDFFAAAARGPDEEDA